MKTVLRWIIQFYRYCISPLLGPRCRFYPTCSQYALEALAIHPLGRASWLISRRLARCHPWGGSGYDPVPPAEGGKDSNSDADQTQGKQATGVDLAGQRCGCQVHTRSSHKTRIYTVY